MSGTMSIAAAVEALGPTLARKAGPTRVAYTLGARIFCDFLRTRSIDPESATPAVLDYADIEDFAAWLVARYGPDATSSTAVRFAGLAALMRFCARRRLLDPSLSIDVALAGGREVLGKMIYHPRRFDPRIPLLVLHMRGLTHGPSKQRSTADQLILLRNRAVVETLFSTAMRREELVRLNRADLAYGDETVIRGKGDRERVVFFDGPTLTAIRAYLAVRGDEFAPVFLTHNRGSRVPADHRLNKQSVWHIVKYYAAEAGLAAVRPHDLRHFKATALLNRGAPLDMVQDILGHASPEITKKVYAHYYKTTVRKAFFEFSASAEDLADELRQRINALQSAPLALAAAST